MRKHDAAPRNQRTDDTDALTVDVIKRQRRENPIVRRQCMRSADGTTGMQHVCVREQDALGLARRAGGVHQHRRSLAFQRVNVIGLVVRQDEAVGVGRYDRWLESGTRDERGQPVEELGRHEDHVRRRMREGVLEHGILSQQVDGRYDTTGRHRTDEDSRCREAVGQHERDDTLLGHPQVAQKRAEAACRAAQLRISQRSVGLRGQQESCVRLLVRVLLDDLPECLKAHCARAHVPNLRRHAPNSSSSVGSCTDPEGSGRTTLVMLRKCR